MKTAGYGPATAPSGWGGHQGCPARREKMKQWEEEEGTQKREDVGLLFLFIFVTQSQGNVRFK